MSRLASSKTARIWAERFAQCERSNAPVAQRTQGGASLCPGFDGPEYSQALKGRNHSARKTIRYRTQGGASLCPGLSHFAPLGRGHHNPIARGLSPVSRRDIVSTTVGKQHDVLPAVSTT